MGVVFSPEVIENGQFPELGAQQAAARFMLEEIFGPPEAETEAGWSRRAMGLGIESGGVYGSVVPIPGRTNHTDAPEFNAARRRADVDIFLSYYFPERATVLPFIGEVFRQAQERFRVPIEANVRPAGDLYDPIKHNLDPLFAEHLLEVQELDQPRWIYNFPADALRDQTVDPNDMPRLSAIAIGYCTTKGQQFGDALLAQHRTAGAEVDLKTLQRALELSSAIGRKVLAATREEGEETPHISDKISMTQLVHEKLDHYASSSQDQAVTDHLYLAGLDQSYNELLEAAINGSASMGSYQTWLRSHYREACQRAHNVAFTWSEILSDRVRLMTGGHDLGYDPDAEFYDA